AVAEARKLGIKVVALLDTDCDPDAIDLPIPGNDDSMRSIELVLNRLTEAILEGRAAAPPEAAPPAEAGSARGDRDRDRQRGPGRGGGPRGPWNRRALEPQAAPAVPTREAAPVPQPALATAEAATAAETNLGAAEEPAATEA